MQMLIMDSTTQGRSWGAPRSIAESVRADGKVLAFFGARISPKHTIIDGL